MPRGHFQRGDGDAAAFRHLGQALMRSFAAMGASGRGGGGAGGGHNGGSGKQQSRGAAGGDSDTREWNCGGCKTRGNWPSRDECRNCGQPRSAGGGVGGGGGGDGNININFSKF